MPVWGWQLYDSRSDSDAAARAQTNVAATVLSGQVALASKERSDALVQSTLQLDADAQRGARVFAENCARCHGSAALGDVAKAIPALAGQRKS